MRRNHIAHKSNRTGSLLLEVSASLAVAAVCLALGLQMYASVARTERLLVARETAMRHADNLLEQVESIPFDKLDTLKLSELTSANPLVYDEHISEISLEVSSPNEEPDAPPSRQIVVTVRFFGMEDRDIQPIRLVGWRFANEASPNP